MKGDLIQQTIYRNGDDEVMTVTGPVKWQTWLRKEWARIRRGKGRTAIIKKNRAGETALFVDDVTRGKG